MNVKCIHCGIAHNCNFCPNCGTPAAQGNAVKPVKKSMSAGGIILAIFLSIAGVFVFMLLVVLLVSMSMPGTNDNSGTVISDSVPDTEVIAKTDIEPDELLFKPGDIITSDKRAVAINSIKFSYDVMPEDTSLFYTHYEADGGEVYIHIDTDVKNLSKKDLDCDDILSVKADYDEGFVYRGFAVVEDSKGFTYALISSIDPLKTKKVHFLISCPEEVIESGKSLFIELKLNGTSEVYRYDMR